MADTIKSLRAEVAELRAEVERLNTALAAAKVPVTVHSWDYGCAGAYAGQVYSVPWANNTAATQLTFGPLHYNTGGAAPVPQVFTYDVGGECA